MIERMLVAIVDGDRSVRRAIERLAPAWGIDTATFTSGGEFISTLEAMPSFEPNCAVLDVDMSDVNGLEAQKYLSLRRPRIPVIILTASTHPRIGELALASGAAAVFQKPFPIDVFVMSLRAYLN